MRILIAGGSGQLGRAVARRSRAMGHEPLPMSRSDLDIARPAAVRSIADLEPDLLINAAAMTDVDGCERDPEAAFTANALGARYAALGCARAGVPMVQVSTDFVFDGRKREAYWEFDAPNPLSAYGASKLAGEHEVRALLARHYIVRTAWLYGLDGSNFVTKMLRLAEGGGQLEVVDNEVGSPTFCDDLADGILALVGQGIFGTYHLANEGACSRFEFTRAILTHAGQPLERVVPTDRFPRLARTPAYAPLRNFAAAGLGVRLPDWRTGLERYFTRRGNGNRAGEPGDMRDMDSGGSSLEQSMGGFDG